MGKSVSGEAKRGKIEIFCCYAREDLQLLQELRAHLVSLQREETVTIWADTDIDAGKEWDKEVRQHLDTSQIILLLVSSDFMASNYSTSVEIRRAMEKHENGDARVIPIILRHADWQRSLFGKLQPLPSDANPIVSKNWPHSDEAFLNVVKGIRNVVESLKDPTIAESSRRDLTNYSLPQPANLIESNIVLSSVAISPIAQNILQESPDILKNAQKKGEGGDNGEEKPIVEIFPDQFDKNNSTKERIEVIPNEKSNENSENQAYPHKIQLRTQQCAIKEIFSNQFVFSIPFYQRPYVWTIKEAEMLLEDLLDAMREVSPYFLGSIVLTKGDKPEAEIIDGQQRLTTITILLAALRASVHSEMAKILESFLREEANTFFAHTSNRDRLTLRNRDADFFRLYIQAKDGIKNLSALPLVARSESQRNIRNNALAFLERLQHISEEERTKLGNFLIYHCFVVIISTTDFNTAYRIFAVLNNRGRHLSSVDILKANIIGDIPPAEREEYTNKWEEIEVLLGSENFQELLTLIRILTNAPQMRRNLLEEFQTYVYPTAQPGKTAQKFVDHLLYPYGCILYAISNASCAGIQYAAEIENLLRWLNRLSHKEWQPVALKYWSQNKDNPTLLLHFLKDLDRLSVGLLLLDMSYHERLERYHQLQTAIEPHNNIYAEDSPLQLTYDEQRNMCNALNGDIYANSNIGLCKYILLRLDSLLSDDITNYNFLLTSVEHVLPQKTTINSKWAKRFPGDLQSRWVHRLGNLVLLARQKDYNADTYDFARKKKDYFSNAQGSSPFALTSQVLNIDEWTPKTVQRRQRELVNKLISYWNLKNSSFKW